MLIKRRGSGSESLGGEVNTLHQTQCEVGMGNLFLIVKQIKELSILVDSVRPGLSRQYFFCFHAQNSVCQKREVQNIPQQH